VFNQLKKDSGPDEGSSVLNDHRGRAVPAAVLLIFVVLLSMGSGIYASASYFAPQASNVTVTTTMYTTTTSWTTLTVWSTVTSTVQGVLTTVQYTTSTSTITLTRSTPIVVTVGGTSSYSNFQGSVRAVAITLPAGASIVSIGINWASTTAGNVELALYSNVGGKAGSLLTQTGSTAMSGSSGWQDIPVSSSYTTSTSGTYWVAFQVSSGRYIYMNSGSNLYCAQSYGAFPNPWCSSPGTGAWTLNMRVTYTTG
jgi:hypothetical protein